MAEMTAADRRQTDLINNAVKGAFADIQKNGGFCNKCCQFCEVTPQVHNEHHKMLTEIGISNHFENHRFVQKTQTAIGKVADKAMLTLTALVVTGIVALIVVHFKG